MLSEMEQSGKIDISQVVGGKRSHTLTWEYIRRTCRNRMYFYSTFVSSCDVTTYRSGFVDGVTELISYLQLYHVTIENDYSEIWRNKANVTDTTENLKYL